MATPKIEVVVKNGAKILGEGPIWDAGTKSLWFVDILGKQICNWNSSTGEVKRIDVDGLVGFAIPTEKGELIAGINTSIVKVNPDTQAKTVVTTVEQGQPTRFNDAKCDASGRLWAGTMALPVDGNIPTGMGSLYRLGSDLKIERVLGNLETEKTTISNGLGWSGDNKTMYFVDSGPRKIFAFDFNAENGTIGKQRVIVDYSTHVPQQTKGVPDGMCVDTEDKLWVATFFGSHVYRIDPSNGKILQELKFPASNISSVCFGGDNLDELYVTSSVPFDVDPSTEPLAGSVFKVTGLGVKGRPFNKFRD